MTKDELARIKSGDRTAIEQWVRDWELPVFRIAYRILGRFEDAEEARQNTLISILSNSDCWPEAKFHDAWIRRCAMNAAITLIRKQRRHVGDLSGVAESSEYDLNDPSELIDLREAMHKLDPQTRALLSLRFDEGLTIREIGDVLKTAHTTIQSRLDRAIQQLQSKLCAGEQNV